MRWPSAACWVGRVRCHAARRLGRSARVGRQQIVHSTCPWVRRWFSRAGSPGGGGRCGKRCPGAAPPPRSACPAGVRASSSSIPRIPPSAPRSPPSPTDGAPDVVAPAAGSAGGPGFRVRAGSVAVCAVCDRARRASVLPARTAASCRPCACCRADGDAPLGAAPDVAHLRSALSTRQPLASASYAPCRCSAHAADFTDGGNALALAIGIVMIVLGLLAGL